MSTVSHPSETFPDLFQLSFSQISPQETFRGPKKIFRHLSFFGVLFAGVWVFFPHIDSINKSKHTKDMQHLLQKKVLWLLKMDGKTINARRGKKKLNQN